ncbi:major facilitator superfamily domain-containing protein [Mycena pura]|uniref:Major facilitator superfamily domain-containing protein n=1 Tax=Mycena pura TaxID=153505 RepID=A0AAD6UYY3_9AGAR|nr:major facilitator superfamily domain-containing protein [Mycena pura]
MATQSPRAPEAPEPCPRPALFTHDLLFVPIPKRLRYYEGRTFHLGLVLYLTLGFSSTFTVANLYWSQPLLIQLSQAFDVSYSKISEVPTLLQAGYAVGVVLISPLGDLIRRRQLILFLLLLSTTFTVGLSVTNSFVAFEILSFFVGMTSIITTIMQPLVADIAPPNRRATAISVVISGLLLGVLVARVLSGVLGQFASWRTPYYAGAAAQAAALAACALVLPDYPAKNAGARLTYLRILRTMAAFAVTEPALIQPCLVNFATSAAFTSFWVTLTFLLGGPLYNYSTLDIGLFGLVGMVGVLLGPLMGRFIDLLVPWYATLAALVFLCVFNAVQMAAGGLSVAAVAVVAFALNFFRQLVQASLATAVLSISAEARGRFNALNVLSIFLGQVMGTSVGSKIYLARGWRACAALSVALSGAQLLVLLARGPQCARYAWVGWQGGWAPVRQPRGRDAGRVQAEVEAAEAEVEEGRKDGGTATATASVDHGGVVEKEKVDPARDAPPATRDLGTAQIPLSNIIRDNKQTW